MRTAGRPYFLTIAAIAKNERRYFPEWIEYHKMMGVEKFYIYDNESTDGTREILAPYIDAGIVEYVFFPGKKMQLKAYMDCVRRHKREAEYMAFIDLDEFIVPIKHKSIPEFLRGLGKISGVEINWIVYGSGGAKKRTDGLVIERFRDHSMPDDRVNNCVKTIANPRRILTFFSTHKPVILFGRYVDSNGDKIRRHFGTRRRLYDTIRINHYATRSHEEFVEKMARGDARFGDNHRKASYFERNDRNDWGGDPIMDAHARKLKEILK